MKKICLNILPFLFKIAIPLVSALIGLKIVDCINVFQVFHLIEDADRAFDVCTSVYFAIVDATIYSGTEFIKNTFFPSQNIQVVLSKPGDMVQYNSIPDLVLREDRPNEAKLTVKINAKKKTCKGLYLVIENPNFATMQLPAASIAACVNAQGNLVIDLEKLFGNQEQTNTNQAFRILFSREPVSGVCQSELYAKLSKEPWLISFETNRMIIRTED